MIISDPRFTQAGPDDETPLILYRAGPHGPINRLLRVHPGVTQKKYGGTVLPRASEYAKRSGFVEIAPHLEKLERQEEQRIEELERQEDKSASKAHPEAQPSVPA